MCAQSILFARRYRAALLDYFLGSDEMGLARAYDLGRAALREGLGLLDILRTHQGATHTIVSSTKSLDLTMKTLAAAAEFLMETLSPYEMTYQGYVASLGVRDLPTTARRSRKRRKAEG